MDTERKENQRHVQNAQNEERRNLVKRLRRLANKKNKKKNVFTFVASSYRVHTDIIIMIFTNSCLHL